MRSIAALSAALTGLAMMLAGCGGPGGPPLVDPNSGRIDGEIEIVGPFDPSVALQIGLLFHATTQFAEQVPVGKVPAAASAYFNGRAIRYSFSALFVGAYVVRVYSDSGAARRQWYEGLPVQPGFNGQVNLSNGSFSFTGPAPYGNVTGEIALTGDWPADEKVFIGFQRTSGNTALLRWPVAEADAAGAILPFDVPGLAFGTYGIGLYSVDAAGVVTPHGMLAEAVTLTLAAPSQAGLSFSADFGGSN